jgi:hypothetical protein
VTASTGLNKEETGINRQLAEEYDVALKSSMVQVREGSRRRDDGAAIGRRQQAASKSPQRSDLICTVCFKSGDVACCNLCPRAYHRGCVVANGRIARGRLDRTSMVSPAEHGTQNAQAAPPDFRGNKI